MTEGTSLHTLIDQRKAKLERVQKRGLCAYPSNSLDALREKPGETIQPFSTAGELRKKFPDTPESEKAKPAGHPSDVAVCVAGRLIAVREMGKASFAQMQDSTGKMQIYLRKEEVGEEQYKLFKDDMDIGDYVGVRGFMFRTKTGELTVWVKKFALLSKSLRPLPEKWHGLKDVEVRFRQRYLDFAVNQQAQAFLRGRAKIVSAMRGLLEERGFLEVATPILQREWGGAAAKPFTTRHEALHLDLFLRVAPELYLKRLLVGNCDRVYEIGSAFRNEGVDSRHNPEFTLLEAYQAYADYGDAMELVETLIRRAAKTAPAELPKPEHADAAEAAGKPAPAWAKNISERTGPFARATIAELLQKHMGLSHDEFMKLVDGDFSRASVVEMLKAKKLDTSWLQAGAQDHHVFNGILDRFVIPKLDEPTFMLDYPKVFSPLAKQHPHDPKNPERSKFAQRFELFIGGEEIANAYSELNDPVEQRARFENQLKQRKQGDAEAMPFDEDFVVALEHGMPPAAGIGIGVDRLAMLLLGADSIREILPFPLLKPEI